LQRVIVEAPATSANLGPGFDVFALALKQPKDRVEVSVEKSGPARVELKVSGHVLVSNDPRTNAAGAVALAIAKKHRLRGRISIKLTKGVPIGVGLGSSGASSAATSVAMNEVFDLGLNPTELIRSAGVGEKTTSGAAHLDNVSAAVMGGFVLVPGQDMQPVGFSAPKRLNVVVATPKVKLPERKTEYARSLLPKKVRLEQLTANVSRASRIVAGFAREDIWMIGQGMEDVVVEPSRAPMIPGLAHVRKAAKDAGASGTSISGAGPSVISIVDSSSQSASEVLKAVLGAFRLAKVEARGYVTTVGEGARIIESS